MSSRSASVISRRVNLGVVRIVTQARLTKISPCQIRARANVTSFARSMRPSPNGVSYMSLTTTRCGPLEDSKITDQIHRDIARCSVLLNLVSPSSRGPDS